MPHQRRDPLRLHGLVPAHLPVAERLVVDVADHAHVLVGAAPLAVDVEPRDRGVVRGVVQVGLPHRHVDGVDHRGHQIGGAFLVDQTGPERPDGTGHFGVPAAFMG